MTYTENTRLPEAWTTFKVNELMDKTASVNPGNTPSKKYELWSVPAFPTDSPEYAEGKEIGSNKQVVDPGDVLLCKINPRINRVWLVREKTDLDQIASTEWIVLRSSEIFPKFFMYQLREEDFRRRLCADLSGVGGSLTRARPRIVGKLDVKLAPFNEQKRIVAKIEELQGRSRRARVALETIPDLLEQLRQSILAATFRGDLTNKWREQHPDVEPASELLKRIRAERRKRWEQAELQKLKTKGLTGDKLDIEFLKPCKQYKEPAPVDTIDLPKLPEGWCWETLDNVCLKIMDGAHHSPPNGPSGERMYITAKNIKPWKIDLSKITYVSKEDHNKIYPRCDVQYNDALYVKDGVNAGMASINNLKEPFSLLSSVGVFRPESGLSPEYLVVYLNSPLGHQIMLSMVSGNAITRLTLTKLKESYVPIPPLSEQETISKIIAAYFQKLDSLWWQFDEKISLLSVLDQSILHKAFRGELVPQDPNDEPAAILLERIRKEKTRQAAVEKAKTEQRGKRMKRPIVKQQDIIAILRHTDRAMMPEELFAAAGFAEDSVDIFYEQLRAAVTAKKIHETRKGAKVHLEAIL